MTKLQNLGWLKLFYQLKLIKIKPQI